MEKNKQIETIINDLFTLDVIRNNQLTLRFNVNNKVLSNQCYFLYNSRPKTSDYNTHVANYIYHTYLILLKADDLDDEQKLLKYLVSQLRFHFSTDDYKQTTIRVDEEGARAVLQFNTVSLDSFLVNENETELSLAHMLSDDAAFFENTTNQIYFNTQFKDWFKKVKHNILTASQIDFLEKMDSVAPNTPYKQIKVETGIDARNIHNRYNRIATRVIKEYESQKTTLKSTYEKDLTKLSRTLLKAITICERDYKLESINEDFFNYIANNFHLLQPHFKLKAEQHQAINRKQFNHQLVYELYVQVCELHDQFNNKLVALQESKQPIPLNNRFTITSKQKLPPKTRIALVVNTDGTLAAKKELK